MCNFNQAWIGKCKKEQVEGKDYCQLHEKAVCSICGEQANKECVETMQFVCGAKLCEKDECRLQHYYQAHGYAFFELVGLEDRLKMSPFKIVVSEVNFGKGKMEEWLNERYKGKFQIVILTTNEHNQITFYRTHLRQPIEDKESILEFYTSTFYEKLVREKGIYFSNEPIHLKEMYTESIIEQLEKVI